MDRLLKAQDIQNFITAMSFYAKTDMISADSSSEISSVWNRMTCIHRFQRRFDTEVELTQTLDTGFLELLHEACERVGVSKEHEEWFIDASGWNYRN